MNKARNTASFPEGFITAADLVRFKQHLLFEIRQSLKEVTGRPTKNWMKSNEIRKLLDISPGTLQTLHNNGTLPSTKLGGVVYYDIDDINKIMDRFKFPQKTQR